MTSPLFNPLKVGAIQAKNRIFMSAMTRCRNALDGTPNGDLLAKYYKQRASTGLIVTEATAISRQGLGNMGSPGLWNKKHAEQWQKVVEAVHSAGGKILAQLWHEGRVVHPVFLNGELPVAPSPIACKGETFTPEGKKQHVTPRELDEKGIAEIINDFATSAKLAREAGFDGIELHGANGYLIDQFIRDGTNKRKDKYGGSIDNRLRFLTEVADAVIAEWGPEKVGVRFSPTNPFQDIKDSDPLATFSRAAELLDKRKMAFITLYEADENNGFDRTIAPGVRKNFKGVLVLNGGYDKASGDAVIKDKKADAISYGAKSLANPDLVERFRTGAPLNQPDPSTFYLGGEKGYIDYPFLDDKQKSKL